ncbi:MAG: ATP-binding protein, partial [Desulfatiglandaceae bacterium]
GIQKAATHATDITRQLLAFARKQTISPQVLDLNDTVEGMLKMLRRLIGEDVDLAWQPDTRLWTVNMDPSQIDQILVNLCVNARDAIEGVGSITIETQNVVLDQSYCTEHPGAVPGEYVMLTVGDDGSGMGQEILANIFEPFFTTKEVGKGTGLGLATVYGIVKQNQGTIDVYSELTRGTTFKIYLPRYTGEEAVELEAAQADIPQGRGETLLLVEDEASVLDVGKEILERLGYTVWIASGPAEAMEIIRQHSEELHLLVTDVVMPEMDGKELARQISKRRPHIRTLFMSGYPADAVAHHGILEKNVNFIQKPFSVSGLAYKIREVLDQ